MIDGEQQLNAPLKTLVLLFDRIKRQYREATLLLPVQAHDTNGEIFSGEIVNLSLSVLVFRTKSWVEPGSACSAEISLPDSMDGIVCGLGISVVRCEACGESGSYWVEGCVVDLPFSTKVWLMPILSD